jgi:hypothetical protein
MLIFLAKYNNMYIYRALFKHGYSNFKLEILDKKIYIYFLIKYIYFIYCDPSMLLERENYYLKLLKPEYNRFFFLSAGDKKKLYYIYNI